MLDEKIVWRVPRTSPIAGDHRGVREVAAYFARRRRLAHMTMRMHGGPLLAEGDAVVQLAEGSAQLGGEHVRWQTVGVYRVRNGRIAAVWLVPLELFDSLWSRAPADDSG